MHKSMLYIHSSHHNFRYYYRKQITDHGKSMDRTTGHGMTNILLVAKTGTPRQTSMGGMEEGLTNHPRLQTSEMIEQAIGTVAG